MACGICGQPGHNRRTCPSAASASESSSPPAFGSAFADAYTRTSYERMSSFSEPSSYSSAPSPVPERRVYRCSYCKQEGHNVRTCKVKEYDEISQKSKIKEEFEPERGFAGASASYERKCLYCGFTGHDVGSCSKKISDAREAARKAAAARLEEFAKSDLKADDSPRKRVSSCSFCGVSGHNIRTCVLKKQHEALELEEAEKKKAPSKRAAMAKAAEARLKAQKEADKKAEAAKEKRLEEERLAKIEQKRLKELEEKAEAEKKLKAEAEAQKKAKLLKEREDKRKRDLIRSAAEKRTAVEAKSSAPEKAKAAAVPKLEKPRPSGSARKEEESKEEKKEKRDPRSEGKLRRCDHQREKKGSKEDETHAAHILSFEIVNKVLSKKPGPHYSCFDRLDEFSFSLNRDDNLRIKSAPGNLKTDRKLDKEITDAIENGDSLSNAAFRRAQMQASIFLNSKDDLPDSLIKSLQREYMKLRSRTGEYVLNGDEVVRSVVGSRRFAGILRSDGTHLILPVEEEEKDVLDQKSVSFAEFHDRISREYSGPPPGTSFCATSCGKFADFGCNGYCFSCYELLQADSYRRTPPPLEAPRRDPSLPEKCITADCQSVGSIDLDNYCHLCYAAIVGGVSVPPLEEVPSRIGSDILECKARGCTFAGSDIFDGYCSVCARKYGIACKANCGGVGSIDRDGFCCECYSGLEASFSVPDYIKCKAGGCSFAGSDMLDGYCSSCVRKFGIACKSGCGNIGSVDFEGLCAECFHSFFEE